MSFFFLSMCQSVTKINSCFFFSMVNNFEQWEYFSLVLIVFNFICFNYLPKKYSQVLFFIRHFLIFVLVNYYKFFLFFIFLAHCFCLLLYDIIELLIIQFLFAQMTWARSNHSDFSKLLRKPKLHFILVKYDVRGWNSRRYPFHIINLFRKNQNLAWYLLCVSMLSIDLMLNTEFVYTGFLILDSSEYYIHMMFYNAL